MSTVLALDISSTMIGWCLYDGAVLAYGEITLKHADVNHRCRLARAQVGGLLIQHPDVDAVATEAPGGSFVGTVIPQCYVSGAVRSLLAERDIAVCDVSAAAGKKALAGKGNAKKGEMQAAALSYGVRGEHASDALGVALVAVGRVREVAA